MQTTVRYFITRWVDVKGPEDEESGEYEVLHDVEVDVHEWESFESQDSVIIYERHTVTENGVNQIILTKVGS